MSTAASSPAPLGDPMRWRIVGLLAGEQLCVGHLATQLDAAQPLVSHHLKVLRDAGLIQAERYRYWTYYRLRPEALDALADQLWLLDDDLMTSVNLGQSSAQALRTAPVAVISLTIQRTSLVWRWLGVAGLIAAAIFMLGSIFSVLGRTPEGNSSLIGVGIFIVWMLVLSAGLWRTASKSTTPHP